MANGKPGDDVVSDIILHGLRSGRPELDELLDRADAEDLESVRPQLKAVFLQDAGHDALMRTLGARLEARPGL